MAERPRPYRVFISHASQDRWVARQMAATLDRLGRRHGVTTFIDEHDMEGGDQIPETVRDHIKAADDFIVLLTSASVERDWVLIELGAAWLAEKRIIAVLDKVPQERRHDIIAQMKYFDLNTFDDLAREVAGRARRRQAP